MGTQQDLENRVSLLESVVAQLVPAVPGLQRILFMQDVNVGATTPLVDGNALVWSTAQHAFVNAPAGAFPITEDNGTETGSVEFDTFAGASLPGALVMLRFDDGTPANNSFCVVYEPAVGGIGASLRSSVGTVNVQSDANNVTLNANGSGIVLFSARIDMGSIPTSDPGISGRLWNSSGTVKISP